MNWLKKQFNKLFFAIDEEMDEEYVASPQQEREREPQTTEPIEKEQKKPFVFPTIKDFEYPKATNHLNSTSPESHSNIPNTPRYIKQEGGISVVYDVETSSMKEVLERRRALKSKKQHQHVSIPTFTRHTHKVDTPSPQPPKMEEEKQQQFKRKFVPTKVPSPVHGFKRPNPIYGMPSMVEKQEEEVETKKVFEEDQYSTLHTPINSEPMELTQHVEEDWTTQPAETIVTQNADSVIEEVTESFASLEQPSIEEPIIEEERLINVEEKSVEEINEVVSLDVEQSMGVEEDEEEIVDEAPSQQLSGSRLPFNVLMLKSDKEKLEAKRFSQSLNVEPSVSKNDGLHEEQMNVQPEPLHHVVEKELVFDEVVEPSNSPERVQEELTIFEEEAATVANPVLANDMLNEPIPYQLPPLSILAPPEEKLEDTEWMEEQGANLVDALSHFQVQAQIESIVQGPAVTQFEITVGQGTKVSKVRNLADDIQLALAARDIRIDAPIPGKRSIGIEIPNRVSRAVRLSEVTNSDRFKQSDSPLEAALGLDLNGNPVTIDLRKMPHGLIAGATGSGKSVCINSILVSLLYKSAPHELKLMLIDPKMVELAPFNHIPHLVSPVITDVKAATESLKWAVDEMERRYQLFMHSGTRDITRYNKLCDDNKMYAQKLPYLLIVIDELADLMMMSPADVELAISRLAQKARACGIHLILATQRPSVDVITGTLKSNIPTRIAFAVSSQIDSRTIIDQQGAERLLGRGDMLYLGNGMNAPQRIQGTFVTDDEIEKVVSFAQSQGEPNYFFKSEELVQKSELIEEQDELFEEVCRFVYSQGSASTSSIQRRYHIGYNRAARLIDMMESQGLISEPKGSKPRDVYITEAMLENMFS